MIEFTLFKIPVRVEASFWLFMGLLGFMINSDSQSDLILTIAIFIMVAFVSILIHEMGHALMIRKYKLPTQIVLTSFGGYATHPVGHLDRLQSFLVTLAGPLVQFVFGLTIFLVFKNTPMPNPLMATFVNYMSGMSIIWAVFNCLPILPLDGGRMLESAMGPRRIKLTLIISMITAVIIAIIGMVNGAIFVTVFMTMFAWQNYQAYEQYKR